MMNRRQFIQMTMTIAAAAVIPVKLLESQAAAQGVTLQWIPTKEEVANWLEYYKAWTAGLRPDIHDITGQGWATFTYDRQLSTLPVEREPDVVAEAPGVLVSRFKQFEDAFKAQESDRAKVGREFLAGYDAGKDGSQRYCARFDRPSNQAYAWYHYWAVGDFDRRYAAGDPAAHKEARSWRSPPPGSTRAQG